MRKAKIEGVKDGYVHVRVRDIFEEPYDSENEEENTPGPSSAPQRGAEGVTQQDKEPKGKEEQIAVREGEKAEKKDGKTEKEGVIKVEEEEEDDRDTVVITEEESRVAGENATARNETEDDEEVEGGSLWNGLFSLFKYIGYFAG